ncbi:YbaY family lipoprotein, partial [Cribrihabitans sp. XS_ASV171]
MRTLPVILLALLPCFGMAQEGREISGSLLYRERIALPPGAEMLLELRDGTGGVVASDTTPTDGAQVPLPFSIAGPGASALSFRGALRVEGEIRWLSAPVAVAPGEGAVDLGDVLLRAHRAMGFSSVLSCGELVAELGFVGEGARLRIGSRYLDLVPERTASGARFASRDAPGTWVWTHGDVATLSLEGVELPECREMLPETRYVARGNEPGWRLETAGGQMRYAGDYGETEIAAPLPEPEIAEGARVYAPEGTDLVLRLGRELCHDDMTGMPYPERAEVETGGRVLRGCAGDPRDLLTAHPWQVGRV